MEKYPEAEKFAALGDEHRAVFEFMEYLTSKGMGICEYLDDTIVPVKKSTQALFFDAYGIDPVKLEDDRRQILEDVRNAA